MAAQIAGVLDKNLADKVNNSKLLVVGAGGIGCEVLKNLVMSGFKDIEIIDLDTIDVSNLNRQFLFHKEHVGKSKAEVARESALAFNPNVNIKAYHDSITTTNYGVSFFQRFNVVLNALDNRQARNHVNRMCLTADVPLIESGTSGYDGQVELIKKGSTQCYECTPKAAQKSYPGCTIRNTPSEPIHCIVWAKHLFNQLFGEHNEDEDVSPDTADPEASASAGDAALEEESNTDGNVNRVSTRKWAQETNYDPEKIFNKLFCDDIKYLLSMSELWKKRTPPNPLRYGEFEQNDSDATILTGTERDQKVWTLRECQSVFATSLNELQKEFIKLAKDDNLIWDKDDRAAMDFVAACANVRAIIFGISQKSRFEIKSMAGNIIPAIATTNAITAGIVVMRTFKVLQEKYDECQSVYVRLRQNARNQIFIPDKILMPPNPNCIVCSSKPQVTIKIDTGRVTIKQFRDDVLVKSLNMLDPDVMIDGKGVIVISSEEDETECNNDKLLSEMDIVDGCILKADDFFQNYELTIIISHKDVERDGDLFEVIADPNMLKAEEEKPKENEMEISASTSTKRNGEPNAKKARTEIDEDSDDDLCLIEDDDEQTKNSNVVKEVTPTVSVISSRNGSSSDQSDVIAMDDDVCVIDDDDDENAKSGNDLNAAGSSNSPRKRRAAEKIIEPLAKRTKADQIIDDDVILIDDDDDDD